MITDKEDVLMNGRPPKSPRKKLLTLLAALIGVSATGIALYWTMYASKYVSTENAYTAVEIAQITNAVEGNIEDIKVTDTQKVKKGDILVKINDQDAAINLAIADAELDKAIRRVKGYNANDLSLNATIHAREADKKRAQSALAIAESEYIKAKGDLERRKDLATSGSIAKEELTNFENAFKNAEANLSAAKSNLEQTNANIEVAKGSRESNLTLIEQASIKDNPEVKLAQARKDKAQLDLSRTIIKAPIDGIVVKRQVQTGQRIQIGTPLLAIVPIQDIHVDANFKEVQLKHIKNGQHVEVISDLYGSDIKYNGTVEGFSGGTGSAMSVIPAQNATGNWIKVVQRLPVRIKLDQKQLEQYPLNVGLSMNVNINISQ